VKGTDNSGHRGPAQSEMFNTRRGFVRTLAELPVIVAGSLLLPSRLKVEKVGLPDRVLYYGFDGPLPEQIPLRAGPLTLVYEAGDIRYIRLGDREILRRLYVAVRDRNWGTVVPRLANLDMKIARESFRISYEAENKQGEIDFFWRGTITGDEGGNIRFTMEGVGRSTFLRNRIGFCVLHPVRECAGQSCTVEQVDGNVINGIFPLYISPHQPFSDMRTISHEVALSLTAEVRMEGDNFEMEDQRNWTDASYKTYCTPLRLPFPVEVQSGTNISQSVALKLKGTIPSFDSDSRAEGIVFTIRGAGAVPLPRFGLGMASHGQPLSSRALGRLRALNLSHLRTDLHLSRPDIEDQLRRATDEARELGLPLEIAIFLTDSAERELHRLRPLLAQLKPAVTRWLVFHVTETSTTEKWIKLARQLLADYDPKAEVGAGTNANFAELNRGRPPTALLDCVSYSINPQVHAFDNASLAENLEAQGATVETARQFTGKAHLIVSPVTLKRRFNAVATGPEPEPAPGELPTQVDVRQMSLFGAGWTLGSIKYLVEGGIHSVTYYETTGWRGVMETDQGSPVPGTFRSLPGGVFPLYHVLADMGEFTGGDVLPSVSSAPLKVVGMVLKKCNKQRILIANLTETEQKVRIEGAALGKALRLRSLDAKNAQVAMTSPESFRLEWRAPVATSARGIEVRLLPFALVAIEQKVHASA
jgi:hypothetical protein